MTNVLGIDLGGTKVLAGVIDVKTGKVLGHAKKRSRAEHGPTDLVERLIEAAKKAIDESHVSSKGIDAIGIGAAGQIDREKGVIIAAPNLAGMSNMPLVDRVKKELGHPTFLFNDVEAAAAGEAQFGTGKGQDDFVVVFVGTGIGGSIYRKGKPYLGQTRTAGEIGHMVIDFDGRICNCGGLGHLEAYASRTAIVKYMLAKMLSGRKSVLSEVATQINPNDPGGSGIRSGSIADALSRHDELVEEALNLGADYLAAGLASVVNFYNPPLIILGGGLVQAVDPFFERVAKGVQQSALHVPAQSIQVKKTGLGDDSGIVGAAVLASRNS